MWNFISYNSTRVLKEFEGAKIVENIYKLPYKFFKKLK